ncbi:hypothetical protein D3C72_1251690 [compost metagenome]
MAGDGARRPRDGPVAQPLMQRIEQRLVCQHEAAADAGETVELADRAQHHQPFGPAVRGDRSRGQAIDEGFIDQQRATAPGQRGMPAQQRCRRQQPGGRVVGIDDGQMVEPIGKVRAGEIRFVQWHYRVPGRGERGCVLAVAERGNPDAPRPQQARQGTDRGLRAGHRQGLRRAEGLGGQLGEPIAVLRQPLPRGSGERRHGIAVGMNAGGQVEPVGFGAAVAAHRGQQVAAMADRGKGRAHVGADKARTASALAPASASHSHKVRCTSRRHAITCPACGVLPAPSGGRCSSSP